MWGSSILFFYFVRTIQYKKLKIHEHLNDFWYLVSASKIFKYKIEGEGYFDACFYLVSAHQYDFLISECISILLHIWCGKKMITLHINIQHLVSDGHRDEPASAMG